MTGRFLHRWAVSAAAAAMVSGLALAAVLPSSVNNDRSGRGGSAERKVDVALMRAPLAFVPNRGQVDHRVAFALQGSRSSLFFARRGLTIALRGRQRTKARVSSYAVALGFVGAQSVSPVGERQLGETVSYFTGPRRHWRTGLPTFAQLRYPRLWAGVDLVYSGTGRRLEYSFIVKPGVDPAAIRLAYNGQRSLRLDSAGALVVQTPVGGFRDLAPAAYQRVRGRRVPVDASFRVGANGRFGFTVGRYDRSRPLVIDPVSLVYAGYIGGAGADIGHAIAVDATGSAYVTGQTESDEASFPVAGGFDTSYNGGSTNAFVAKVKPDGSGLDYAAYIGGNSVGNGIAVDGSGSAYLTGSTGSTEATFPVAGGPDTTYNGGTADAFVAKVKGDGSGLDYAGYIGGAGADGGTHIALGSGGSAYVAGNTGSTEATFPVAGGPDTTYNGGTADAFVAKVKGDGSGLDFAGYIGGSNSETAPVGIAVDGSGNAYVAGNTASTEATFPVSGGPDMTFNGGPNDAFVAKVKSDGSGLDYAGYIGGNSFDAGHGIAVDAGGSAYVVGATSSTQATFPVSVGPDLTLGVAPAADGFVAKVRPDGSGLDYAGYIGGGETSFGDGGDSANGIAVDSAGSAYVTGWTDSDETTFPATVGPDTTYNLNVDVFVAKVKPDGSAFDFAGYIGGAALDQASGIAVDAAGSVYVTGDTQSDATTFPATIGPDTSFNGGNADVLVAKVSTGDADANADGISDSLQPPGTPSGTFTDTSTSPVTTGSIVSTGGLAVAVTDAPSPDGVRISVGAGTGHARLRVCGGFSLQPAAGSTVVVTCGSVIAEVLTGSAQIVLGDGLTVVSIPAGVTVKVDVAASGSYTVQNLGGGTVTITVDGVDTTLTSGAARTVTAWRFVGFAAPIDNGLLNVGKAGRAIPLKWRLTDAAGAPIKTANTAAMTLSTASLNCASLNEGADDIEEYATGASGFRNLGDGQYQVNWDSPKSYAGQCKVLRLNLGEGTAANPVYHSADFKFTK